MQQLKEKNSDLCLTLFELQCNLSAQRRFFALFITFDFLLSTLLWLICLMANGGTIKNHLIIEVVQYTIELSLFDIVILATFRFTALLIFYTMLKTTHWWVVAVTTLFTCIFLLIKIFIYKIIIVVILVISSFILSWVEAWLLDFKIFPQETLVAALMTNSELQSQSLLQDGRIQEFFAKCHESVSNYYSVEGYTAAFETDNVDNLKEIIPDEQMQLQKRGKALVNEVWLLLSKTNWKIEKEMETGDIFCSAISSGRKIYKAIINISPRQLLDEFFCHFDKITKWNSSLVACEVLKTDISYQLAADALNGLVSKRDFVLLRHWESVHDGYILAYVSVDLPLKPPVNKIVRAENGPSCWMMKPFNQLQNQCKLEWLLQIDLKGWISKHVVDQTISTAMLQFIVDLKHFCQNHYQRL